MVPHELCKKYRPIFLIEPICSLIAPVVRQSTLNGYTRAGEEYCVLRLQEVCYGGYRCGQCDRVGRADFRRRERKGVGDSWDHHGGRAGSLGECVVGERVARRGGRLFLSGTTRSSSAGEPIIDLESQVEK